MLFALYFVLYVEISMVDKAAAGPQPALSHGSEEEDIWCDLETFVDGRGF
jgi:hypothetical protein